MGGTFGLCFIMMLFWMPETAYVRRGAVNLDIGSHNVSSLVSSNFLDICLPRDKVVAEINLSQKAEADHVEEGEKEIAGSGKGAKHALETPSPSQDEPHSFYKNLLPYSGYVNHVSFFNTIFRPFVLLGSPAVLWATLLFTTCVSWLVGISITLSQIFSAPPYNFSVSGVGLTNLSSFVASLIATLIAGPTIDGLVRRMSIRNGGTFGRYTR